MGITNSSVLNEVRETLANYCLPTEIPEYLEPDDIIEKIKRDKKNKGTLINIVFIEEIGKVISSYVKSVDIKTILNIISRKVIIEKIAIDNLKDQEIKIINLKGSKSICNRALILSCLSKENTTLKNFLFCEDTIVNKIL